MRLILTVSSIFCCLLANAQNSYNTLKVEGCIKKLSSTECLNKGEPLTSNEKIIFDKPNSFAVLMNSAGEMVTIKAPDTTGYFKGRELSFSIAEAAKTNKPKESGEASRGVANQQVTNFADFIGTGRFTVIGDEVRFGLSSRLYPVSKDKFLVLHYSLDTTKVSKRLGFRDQVIRIQKNRLTDIDGRVYDKNKIEGVNLYYYEPATKATERLASFDLLFISQEQLYADFDVVYRTLPDKEKKKPQEIATILETFFGSYYGKTDLQSLRFTIDEYVTKLIKP